MWSEKVKVLDDQNGSTLAVVTEMRVNGYMKGLFALKLISGEGRKTSSFTLSQKEAERLGQMIAELAKR